MAGEDKPAEAGEGGKPEAAREGAASWNNRYCNCRASRSSTTSSAPKAAPFVGRVLALNRFVYDCSDNRQSEQFVKTTKEISGYVGREFGKGGDDVRIAVDTLMMPVLVKLARPTGNNKFDKFEWQNNIRSYQTRCTNLEDGMKRLYNIVYGQCSKTMIQRLTALENFEVDILGRSDAIALLMAIKRILFNFQSQKFEPQSISDAMKQFYLYQQGPNVASQAYLEQFTNNVDVVMYCGGSIGTAQRLSNSLADERNIDLTLITEDKRHYLKLEARDRYLATVFILGADQVRYGGLICNIENNYLNGTDKFPKTITAAYNLLVNWKGDPNKQPRGVISDGVAFMNDGVALAQPA
jgi:hypothetical protein